MAVKFDSKITFKFIINIVLALVIIVLGILYYIKLDHKPVGTNRVLEIKIDSSLIDSIQSLNHQIQKQDSIIKNFPKSTPYEKINYSVLPDSDLIKCFQSEIQRKW